MKDAREKLKIPKLGDNWWYTPLNTTRVFDLS